MSLSAPSALDYFSTTYAGLSGAVHTHTANVVSSAALSDPDACAQARDDMLDWCAEGLLQHFAAAREAVLPRVGATARTAVLAEILAGDQERIISLVSALREAPTLVHAAMQAFAIQTTVERYLQLESRQAMAAILDTEGSLSEAAQAHLEAASAYLPGLPSSGCGGDCGSCSCGGGGAPQ